jgi:hypothetical protein
VHIVQQVKGYINSHLNRLFVENDREMMIYVETVVRNAGADEMIIDSDALFSTLTQAVQMNFNPALHVLPIDARTGRPADEEAPIVYISVEPKQKKIIRQ